LKATRYTPLVSNTVDTGHSILFGKLNLGDCDWVSYREVRHAYMNLVEKPLGKDLRTCLPHHTVS
jgi:hypothetical protein